MERVARSCVVSLLALRRGYSVAAAVTKAAAGRRAADDKVVAINKRAMGGKKDVNTAAAAGEEKTAWVPDPVTGYYRPAGGASKEVDAAELRAKLVVQSSAD